jgi:hypothetical protein
MKKYLIDEEFEANFFTRLNISYNTIVHACITIIVASIDAFDFIMRIGIFYFSPVNHFSYTLSFSIDIISQFLSFVNIFLKRIFIKFTISKSI